MGGAINGQVILWDISRPLHTIDQRKRKQSVRHIGKPGLGADEDEPVASLPPVRPWSVSHIDMSHRRLVSDLAWLPATTQVRTIAVGIGFLVRVSLYFYDAAQCIHEDMRCVFVRVYERG